MLKKKLRHFIRGICCKSKYIRYGIYRLNNLIAVDENFEYMDGAIKEDEIITEQSMYRGNFIDYFNYKLLTKEERANELKRIFYINCGYYLDLDNPKTFNQKIQWLKLYYQTPLMEQCVDKCEFKRYITSVIGSGYVVPTYGEYINENDIDFNSLPEQFVLKSNVQSDSRHIIIVKNKKYINIDKIKTILSFWLQRRNNLCSSYCSAYHNVKPKILIEKYIEAKNGSLIDYKFMCFNGEAKLLFTVIGRNREMYVDFYDLEWNKLPFKRKYPNSNYNTPKPKNFELMIEIANKLAKPFPFVRVDFYEDLYGKLYIGELTFYPGGGYEIFNPSEWDYRLGELLSLPINNIHN